MSVELPLPFPPNAEGETLCGVRWMYVTPDGWVGAWDRKALDAYALAYGELVKEACAKVCDEKYDEKEARYRARGHHNEYENGALDAYDMSSRAIRAIDLTKP